MVIGFCADAAQRPSSPARPAQVATNPGKRTCGPGQVQRLVRPRLRRSSGPRPACRERIPAAGQLLRDLWLTRLVQRLQDEEAGRVHRLRICRGDVRARLHDGAPDDMRVVLAHLLSELGRDEPPL